MQSKRDQWENWHKHVLLNLSDQRGGVLCDGCPLRRRGVTQEAYAPRWASSAAAQCCQRGKRHKWASLYTPLIPEPTGHHHSTSVTVSAVKFVCTNPNLLTYLLTLSAHLWCATAHSVNDKPVKRLPSVARLPPAFYIVPHAGWNYGIVTQFLQLKIRTWVKMFTNLTCMHAWKKQTLVFLIHAHFAVTTVLSNVLSNHFSQQNKLTITSTKW